MRFQNRLWGETIAATVSAALLLAALPTHADLSETIGLQGRLLGAGGAPVADGDYGMTVSFYKNKLDDKAVYVDVKAAVKVINGLFSVQVGAPAPLNSAVFKTADAAWVGVTGPMIKDGAVTAAKLGKACKDGETLQFGGGKWACAASSMLGAVGVNLGNNPALADYDGNGVPDGVVIEATAGNQKFARLAVADVNAALGTNLLHEAVNTGGVDLRSTGDGTSESMTLYAKIARIYEPGVWVTCSTYVRRPDGTGTNAKVKLDCFGASTTLVIPNSDQTWKRISISTPLTASTKVAAYMRAYGSGQATGGDSSFLVSALCAAQGRVWTPRHRLERRLGWRPHWHDCVFLPDLARWAGANTPPCAGAWLSASTPVAPSRPASARRSPTRPCARSPKSRHTPTASTRPTRLRRAWATTSTASTRPTRPRPTMARTRTRSTHPTPAPAASATTPIRSLPCKTTGTSRAALGPAGVAITVPIRRTTPLPVPARTATRWTSGPLARRQTARTPTTLTLARSIRRPLAATRTTSTLARLRRRAPAPRRSMSACPTCN